jgi:hypothetical protein
MNKKSLHNNNVHITSRGLVVRQLPPSARGRIAVPCPSDRNALRNPTRQHVPTVVCKLKKHPAK